MEILFIFLLLIGFGMFFFAFIGVNPPRVSLIAGGLACWILVPLIERLSGATSG